MLGKRRIYGPQRPFGYKRAGATGRRKYSGRRKYPRSMPMSKQLVGATVDRNTVYVNAECVVRQFSMNNVGLNGDNFTTVNRYDYSGVYPGVASSIGINDSPRFNQLRGLYREFIITGVRIEITPNDRETVPEAGQPVENMLQAYNVYDDINITTGWTVPAL